MSRQTVCRLPVVAALLLPFLPSPLPAQPSGGEQVSAVEERESASRPLHRYARLIMTGTAALGRTDGNRFLFGDQDTEVENGDVTVVMIAKPKNKWTFFGQVNVTSMAGEVETTVDYLLAEWAASDSFKLAVGRAHHPFGVYGDVFRIGVLRPLLTLPQSIYGTVGMVGENYTGLTVKGSHDVTEQWTFDYDVYGGNIDIRTSLPWVVLTGGRFDPTPGLSDIDETLGARVVMSGLNGVSFGLSAYRGTQPSSRNTRGAHEVYGAHVRYLSDRWQMSAEIGRHDHFKRAILDGAYLEVAHSFREKWQVAARYDWADVEIDGFDISGAPSLWDHRDVTLGVSYWVNPNLVLRAEVHDIEGNRFALPDDLAEAVMRGDLDRETRLVQFGVQFRY